METRNGELARVQQERGKTTERVSECEGRVGEVQRKGACVHISIIIMYPALRRL